MKINILLITFLPLTCICCQSYKAILNNSSICYYDTILAKEDLLFDVSKYDSLLNHGEVSIPRRSEYFDINFAYRLNHNHAIYNWQSNTATSVYKFTNYTLSGNLKRSSFAYKFSYLGKSISYDDQGNITEIKDYDKGYKVCWAQAIEIAKKIARRDLSRDSLTYIALDRTEWRDSPDFKPQWEVIITTAATNQPPPEFVTKKKVYILDGITGELIKTYILKRSTHDTIDIRPR